MKFENYFITQLVDTTHYHRVMLFALSLISYPSYHIISALFDISVPTVKDKIHSCSFVYRETYIQHVRWPPLEERMNFQGRWQKLPFDVGGIDRTSTEIYRPGIKPQEHYYSGNRHYHCIHTTASSNLDQGEVYNII